MIIHYTRGLKKRLYIEPKDVIILEGILVLEDVEAYET